VKSYPKKYRRECPPKPWRDTFKRYRRVNPPRTWRKTHQEHGGKSSKKHGRKILQKNMGGKSSKKHGGLHINGCFKEGPSKGTRSKD
jgi:hypothetical protein